MPDNSPIQRVRRLRLVDSVAAELELMITRGDFAVGQQLEPERLLAERFGVGRSSMREALKIAEADGLLRIDHGVGVFVASHQKQPRQAIDDLRVLDDVTVPELFEVRRTLERTAAAMAARRITPGEARGLHARVTRAGDSALSDADFLALDADLHLAIVKITKNRLLVQLYEIYRALFLTYSERVLRLPARRQAAQRDHEEIVTAIVRGRSRDARDAVVRHLRAVEADVVEHLRSDSPRERPP